MVFYSPAWLLTPYVTKDNLKLLIFLPLPLKYWDDRHVISQLFYAMLRTEPRAPCMLGKRPTNCFPVYPLFKNLYVLLVYVSVCAPHACGSSRRSKEDVRSPVVGVIDGYELTDWELNSSPFEEQSLLLTADLSLQPLYLSQCISCIICFR